MSRYIDADKLVAWCMRTYQAQSTTEGKAYVNAFLTAVDSCPTADVVEVVRRTVRKMQDRLKANRVRRDGLSFKLVDFEAIDRVAAEMLDGE